MNRENLEKVSHFLNSQPGMSLEMRKIAEELKASLAEAEAPLVEDAPKKKAVKK